MIVYSSYQSHDFFAKVNVISIGLRDERNVTCYGFAASSENRARRPRFDRDFRGKKHETAHRK